ncbi:hypothetical protein QJS04_geneDACA003918 [Acorus gramineus]|uniref:Uncharacterized protein n=1 Tax=Acorus gramineus TaxID=55184 RepID=A0AAV9BHD5_ACOGR|nr:hypothetical protein QJS04_geneDACA003918 [Acorus gramineus]
MARVMGPGRARARDQAAAKGTVKDTVKAGVRARGAGLGLAMARVMGPGRVTEADEASERSQCVVPRAWIALGPLCM